MYLFCKGKIKKEKASSAEFSEEAHTIKKNPGMRKSAKEESVSNLNRSQIYSASLGLSPYYNSVKWRITISMMLQNEARTKKRECTQQVVSPQKSSSEEYIHELELKILSHQSNTKEEIIKFKKDRVVILAIQKK